MLFFQHSCYVLVTVGEDPDQLLVLSTESVDHCLFKKVGHLIYFFRWISAILGAGLGRKRASLCTIDNLANFKKLSSIDPISKEFYLSD